jgi:hypothetical protein
MEIFSCLSEQNESIILKHEAPVPNVVTCSKLVFFTRVGTVLKKFPDFKWDNVLMAGSLVSGLLQDDYDEEFYKLSDIDLFVYASDEKKLKNRLLELYNYFIKKLGSENTFSFKYNNNMTITILSNENDRSIQLIGTLTNSNKFKNKNLKTNQDIEMAILEDFDLTNCQIGFNGNDIVYTPKFRTAIRTRVSEITKNTIQLYRIIKSYMRGYSIKYNKDGKKLCILNYACSNDYNDEKISKEARTNKFKTRISKWYPNNLQENISEILRDELVNKNLTKNYIPSKTETKEQVFQNIIRHYSSNIMIISENKLEISRL